MALRIRHTDTGAEALVFDSSTQSYRWVHVNKYVAAEIERLRGLAREVIEAEDEVRREARRAEKRNGAGWSSAPTVRRIYAMRALRAAINQPMEDE